VDAQLKARLTEIAGAKRVNTRLDSVTPGSAEEVVAVCRACAELGTPISAVSGAVTTPAPGGRAVSVSLVRLNHVQVHLGAMVVRAGAGATLDSLRSEVEGAGMALVGVPGGGPGEVHAGSLVARGQIPRRALTGIVAVLPQGEVVRAGGGVLKDVTGYDLAGVLLGSMGRLAVITEVSFRLQPREARTTAPEAPLAAVGAVSTVLRHAFDPDGLLVAAR
jgi:FAD/FMN-containing dehydrogenase